MTVTIQDIANELNLSASTVSRSLRNDRVINPQTRAKIQAAAMDMGYQGRIRRKTTRISSKTLRIVITFSSESYEAARHNSNFLRYIEGIEAEADALNARIIYEAIPYEIRGKLTRKTLPASIKSGKPDAVLTMWSVPVHDIELISQFAPIISQQWDYDPIPCDVVRPNEEKAIRNIVIDLANLGHRRMMWVSEYNFNHVDQSHRITGFIEAMLKLNLPFDDASLRLSQQLYEGQTLPYLTDHTQGIAQPQLLKQWIDQGVTAFVCVNDRVAYNVMLHLQQIGIDVPGQVSVTGFDATPTPEGMPKLTSVDQLFMEQARTAVRMAQQRKERPTGFPQRVQHLCKLVNGDTTAPPRDLT
jgi:LacI family transcriptional regulator